MRACSAPVRTAPVADSPDRQALVADGLLRIDEAARHLAVSTTTVKRLLRSGQLPYVRVGADRRIPKRAIDAYLAERLVLADAV